MANEMATLLSFLPKGAFLDYVKRSLALPETTVKQIGDEQLQSMEQSQPLTEDIFGAGTVGDAIMAHVTHVN